MYLTQVSTAAHKRVVQLDEALLIMRLMGVRQAAQYLRKCGWALQKARWALLAK